MPAESKGVLVTETPLGLSREQMLQSNEAAVKSLQEEAVAADRKRLGDLQDAFPDDPAGALQAYQAGQSVTEAKAAAYDKLAPLVKTQKEEIATLKQQVEEGKVTFSRSDKEDGKTKPAGDAGATDAAAEKIWANNPKLRAEFGDQKKAFLLDYKHNPGDYASK